MQGWLNLVKLSLDGIRSKQALHIDWNLSHNSSFIRVHEVKGEIQSIESNIF